MGDEEASILKFRRLRILPSHSGWLWVTFSTYRLSVFSLEEFLNRKFGGYNFFIEVEHFYLITNLGTNIMNRKRTAISSFGSQGY